MKLVEIRADGEGVAELEGSRHAVNLSLVSDPRIGDYVIIHAGYAIEKMDQAEADASLALFAEIAQAVQAESRPPEP
jgi:hydrogenase expression/formation protein HypC